MQNACAVLLSTVACPALQYFFPHYSHKQHDFRGGKKKSLNVKCVFWFPLQLHCETFLILRRTERDTTTYVHWSSGEVPGILVIFLMQLEYSGKIFEKYSNIKFHENPSSGGRVVPCGQADGHTVMTKLTAPFRNFANAPKTQHGYKKPPCQRIPTVSIGICSTHFTNPIYIY